MKILSDVESRKVYFMECLAYFDGEEVRYFYGISKGSIAETISPIDTLINGPVWGEYLYHKIIIKQWLL